MNIKISTLSILAALGMGHSSLQAQHNNEFYNDGALVHIQAGAEVHVWGDVHMNGATGLLENNGLIKVQGDMYSDADFQQRGTGTTRIENSDVNIGERQSIQGSYAVRGASAQIGVNDGSFYNLELANDQGVVYLVNTGAGTNPEYVADVRNQVNFLAGGVSNRIITHDVGRTGAIVNPANGAAYDAEFGMMNTTPGLVNYLNNNATTNGNASATDAAYIQGKHRRAISPTGGTYGFLVGLEPSAINGQRGFQYMLVDMANNSYDVIRGYFQSGSPNNAAIGIECSGYQMDDFWGNRHGEWVLDDVTGSGAGDYTAQVWPQDPSTTNFTGTTWTISKDDVYLYPSPNPLHNNCGPTPVGLARGPFNGFSEFGVVSATILLDAEIKTIDATAINNKFIKVDWTTSQEKDLDYFEVQRSTDDMHFQTIGAVQAVGNSTQTQEYFFDDRAVLPNTYYYYRIKSINTDGTHDYTNSVVESIQQSDVVDNVNLFPNPISNGNATLEITLSENAEMSLLVYDAIGQLIENRQITAQVGINSYSIQTADWPAGVYFVHLKGATMTKVKELIKSE